MKDYEIKKSIVDVAQMLNRKGLVGTYEGNISVKDGDRVYLTPSVFGPLSPSYAAL